MNVMQSEVDENAKRMRLGWKKSVKNQEGKKGRNPWASFDPANQRATVISDVQERR